jgi:hypothetical protein
MMTERVDGTGCGAAQLKDGDVESASRSGARPIQRRNSDGTAAGRRTAVRRRRTAAVDDDEAAAKDGDEAAAAEGSRRGTGGSGAAWRTKGRRRHFIVDKRILLYRPSHEAPESPILASIP